MAALISAMGVIEWICNTWIGAIAVTLIGLIGFVIATTIFHVNFLAIITSWTTGFGMSLLFSLIYRNVLRKSNY